MSFLKYKELTSFATINDIDQELIKLQKILFELKINIIKNKDIKPHLFKHTKHKIAQLKFKKSLLVNI